jgi:hypothetical protein
MEPAVRAHHRFETQLAEDEMRILEVFLHISRKSSDNACSRASTPAESEPGEHSKK